MIFVLGMVAGAAIALVAFVAYMAPKHWDWYHENVDLRSQLKVAVERAAHFQALSTPNQWGPVEQFKARIVPTVETPWVDVDVDAGPIEHRFDDILDGGK